MKQKPLHGLVIGQQFRFIGHGTTYSFQGIGEDNLVRFKTLELTFTLFASLPGSMQVEVLED